MSINNRPEPRCGRCRICGGNVTETFIKEHDLASVVYGTIRGFIWKSSGLSCKLCGVKYEFIPESNKSL